MKKLDILTPIGLVLAFALVMFGISMGGTGIKPFIDMPSLAITLGGSFSAVLVTFSIADIKKIPKYFKLCTTSNNLYKMDLVDQFKEISKKIRKDGVLAIEEEVSQIEDEFLKKGLELVIDGVDTESIKEILETEIAEKEVLYSGGSKMFKVWGSYAPAFGMVGTLIGLIQMLTDMGSPEVIASGMSKALITTFYGALFSNAVLNPIGFNIEGKGEKEVVFMEMMICGISSIQNGESTRVIEEKLIAFLDDKERAKYYKREGNEKVADLDGA
ncbi:motility protein A [Romboutsia sp. 1001713B170131_170501_G6]|uniref:motility protein A n=1 Tax=Romboutsia sp. 1001713B170131_170501_G6 TaxID=2787108 RepID=UPI0018A88587|nr:motility protein A [Romboutsia sp. 1001713B170131_170501_G6]